METEHGSDPPHAILPDSHEWEVVAVALELRPPHGTEPWLDLTVERDGRRRSLRFWSPRDLEIERGGPAFTHGLVIFDLEARGWDRVGVRVDDREASRGAIRFVARAVDDISPERAG